MQGQWVLIRKHLQKTIKPTPYLLRGERRVKNKKINIALDIEDLLGLKEPSKDSLEYDLNFIINNGMDEYLKLQEDEKRKDREFIELFKRNYNDIVRIIEFDPHKRIPVNCFTCIKGMDLSKQYGKPKRKE